MALEIVRRFVNGAWKTEAAEAGGGGSQPVVTTGTLSTDPNTFEGMVVVDCGAPAAVVVTFQPTVFTGAGETFGTGPGDLGAGFGAKQSLDGLTYLTVGGIAYGDEDVNGFMSSLSHHEGAVGFTPRYVQITTQVVDDNSGNTYAGANHPVCTGTYRVSATLL